jgi:hypothetical protein
MALDGTLVLEVQYLQQKSMAVKPSHFVVKMKAGVEGFTEITRYAVIR